MKKLILIGLSLLLLSVIGLSVGCNRSDLPDNPAETQQTTISVEEFRQHMQEFNIQYAEDHPEDLDTRGFKEWLKKIWTPIHEALVAIWNFLSMVGQALGQSANEIALAMRDFSITLGCCIFPDREI